MNHLIIQKDLVQMRFVYVVVFSLDAMIILIKKALSLNGAQDGFKMDAFGSQNLG